MLPGRTLALQSVCLVYKMLGVPLVVQSGNTFCELVAYDDAGLFLYVPYISYFFDLSPLQSQKVFIVIIALSFFLLSSLGIFLFSKTRIGTLFTFIFFALFACKVYTMHDVYIGYIVPFIPLMLFFAALEKGNERILNISAFLIGFCACIGSLIRIFASFPVLLLFFFIGSFSSQFSKRKKVGALLFFILGYGVPYLHYKRALNQKAQFLATQGIFSSNDYKHIFWHNIYISFGFIQNRHGIVWEDDCNSRAIKRVNPHLEVGSEEGEKITKQLILNLIQEDRHFVLISLFAKLGIVIMFFLLWLGWVGLFCAYLVPKPWYYELAFLLSLGCSAAPGLVTIPCFEYLAGFVVCTVIYTGFSFIMACNNFVENKIKNLDRGWIVEL